MAAAATGTGREIVGSLMASCYGRERVFVLNEIAAHAEGALHFDPRVDTIFEIGGQDAKYIRLAGGRVYDAAMNEACSAGTGSFIEEQGRKFAGIDDVVAARQAGAVGADCGRLARPALLGVHGRDHRRGGGRRRGPRRDHRRHLRLHRPELPQPRQGQPLGGQSDLLPGHAVLRPTPWPPPWPARPAARWSSRPTPAPSAPWASRCSPRGSCPRAAAESRWTRRAFWRPRWCARTRFVCKLHQGLRRRRATSAASTASPPWWRASASASSGAAAARCTTGAPAGASCPDLAPDPFRARARTWSTR